MINFVILTPLVITGLVSVCLREQQRKKSKTELFDADNAYPHFKELPDNNLKAITGNKMLLVDDVVEIKHYQKVSSMALVASASGAMFYPPIALVSIPLLSYDAFYLLKTIQRSNFDQRSPTTAMFELVTVGATLISKHFVWCSLLLMMSFSIRKIILQLGNFTQLSLPDTLNKQFTKVWVLHNQIEVETNLEKVQKGEILVVHAGEVIALSGIVSKGQGEVEQYSLNGITQILPKQPGDWVLAFSRVNSGRLQIRYT